MHPVLRLIGIALVFGGASIAWLVLGGVTHQRTYTQSARLGPEVADLWGQPHQQTAPALEFHWQTEQEQVRTETKEGKVSEIRELVQVAHQQAVDLASTRLKVKMGLDARLKGLVWYSLFGVVFDGQWSYTHRSPESGKLKVFFRFPDPQGLYDDFKFTIDGLDRAPFLKPDNGMVSTEIDVTPGQVVSLAVSYRSRGMDEWRYVPASGVTSLEDFELVLDTDFAGYDFPQGTISPSSKIKRDQGWQLRWTFARVVTGQQMGVRTPQRIQPGELASALSFSAPVSLLFFFLVVFVISTLRRIDIHPINYVFIAGAFFAFHLLFAYSVDHLAIAPAFALSSVVSIVLVVSYLRLVVSARFAFVEAALAQLVYLIGFSLAHFWEGYTGLTVTVLAILTLFLLMQATGRIRWTEVLRRGEIPKPVAAPVA